jgi:hypothetical protein
MENNRNRRKLGKPVRRTIKVKRNASNGWFVRTSHSQAVGFASSAEFIIAVSKIYHQEENDIERFLKFAESHKTTKAK